MNILITGGAGYVGTELAQLLTENNAVKHIIIYDNLARNNYNLFLENSLNSNKISFVHGDILDGRKLKKNLINIDIVYHLAAKVTTPYSDQELHQYEQVNHWGTSVLVSAIRDSSVRQLIYLSSAAVYGFSDNPFSENSTTNPSNHYGITKLRAEKEVELLSEKCKVNIVRSANVYGYSRSMRFDSVINRFMFDANFNNKIYVYGNGRQYRAYVSIQYLSNLLTQLIFENNSPIKMNVVEHNISVNEIIFEYLKNIYPNLEVQYVNQDIPVKSMTLETNFNLSQYEHSRINSFLEYLYTFKNKFSFN